MLANEGIDIPEIDVSKLTSINNIQVRYKRIYHEAVEHIINEHYPHLRLVASVLTKKYTKSLLYTGSSETCNFGQFYLIELL